MTDDILSQASRALRETTQDDDAAARFTRARVMASLHQARRRRGIRFAILIPLAAILVGSTAWGAASGRFPAVFRAVVGLVVGQPKLEPAEPPPAAPTRRAAGAPTKAPTALPIDSAEDEVEIEPGDTDGEPTVEEQAPAPPPAPSARRAPIDPEGSVAFAAYRRAHEAHFSAQDPAAALAAWNEYLRLAPGGRFALEASYNRALCLVRLGRGTEALAALGPFAEGRFGGYRQREARELMAALGGTAPPKPTQVEAAPAPAPGSTGTPASEGD
ncbi:MAG: hypothetical protein JW751_13735 [Polyangiaceae bacterium]|nr:hypothetical protein [Polyangiaceae bacterium]